MNAEEIKAKMENIEDPETKQIIEDLNGFVFPKFQELQEKLSSEKPGMFKMLKIAKEFTGKLQEEYKEKFGRDFEKDMKKANEYFGFSQMDMLNMMNKKGMKKANEYFGDKMDT
jgi:ribosomal protein S17E